MTSRVDFGWKPTTTAIFVGIRHVGWTPPTTSLRNRLLNRIEGIPYLSIYDNLAWVHRGQYLRWPSTFPSKQMRPPGRLCSSIRSKDGLSRFCRYGWQQIFCLGRRLDLLQHASQTPPCSLRLDQLLQDWCFRFKTDGVVWFTSKAGHVGELGVGTRMMTAKSLLLQFRAEGLW